MTLPEIQERLHAIADELLMPLLFPRTLDDISREVHHLSRSISRRKALDRTPPVSRPMSDQLAEQIRDYKALHPKASHHLIAERFGVVGGRVSEALRGKRT